MCCSAADTYLKLLDRLVCGARFLTRVCFSVTLLIFDLWQSCVCCIKSGKTRYILYIVLYLCYICQYGLHAVLWSHIGILMSLLAVEPRSTAGPLFPSYSAPVERSYLLTLYSVVWDRRVQELGHCLFIGLSCTIHCCLIIFPVLFFPSTGWYCWAGFFGLIGCRSLSPSLALLTSFNNNDNYPH